MVLNLHLEKRLADQRMHEEQCVAKLDCLLQGRFREAKQHSWGFPDAIALLPVLMLALPMQLVKSLLRGR